MTKVTPKIAVVVSDLFEENCYILHLSEREDCLVFDPGLNPDKIVGHLLEENLTPAAIICTHGHSDHIAGNGELKRRWPDAPLIIGHEEAEKLTDPTQNLSAGYGVSLVSPPADALVKEGDSLQLAGLKLSVRETPGHSAGHVVFVIEDVEPTIVIGGDVLFAGSIGRTDFQDGDFGALERSIREKLYTLPDDTIILPGHGGETTVGAEKRGNPFVRA